MTLNAAGDLAALPSYAAAIAGAAAAPLVIAATARCRHGSDPPLRPSRLLLVVLWCAAAGLIVGRFPWPVALVYAAALVPMSAAAWVDLLERRLPDVLTLPAAAITVTGLGAITIVEGGPWATALAGSLVFASALLLLGVLTGGVGLGDVKAAVCLGALLGWRGWSVWFGGVLAGLMVLVLSGTLMWMRRGGSAAPSSQAWSLPYGPAMLVGAFAAMTLLP